MQGPGEATAGDDGDADGSCDLALVWLRRDLRTRWAGVAFELLGRPGRHHHHHHHCAMVVTLGGGAMQGPPGAHRGRPWQLTRAAGLLPRPAGASTPSTAPRGPGPATPGAAPLQVSTQHSRQPTGQGPPPYTQHTRQHPPPRHHHHYHPHTAVLLIGQCRVSAAPPPRPSGGLRPLAAHKTCTGRVVRRGFGPGCSGPGHVLWARHADLLCVGSPPLLRPPSAPFFPPVSPSASPSPFPSPQQTHAHSHAHLVHTLKGAGTCVPQHKRPNMQVPAEQRVGPA